jgi:hypothetical protein
MPARIWRLTRFFVLAVRAASRSPATAGRHGGPPRPGRLDLAGLAQSNTICSSRDVRDQPVPTNMVFARTRRHTVYRITLAAGIAPPLPKASAFRTCRTCSQPRGSASLDRGPAQVTLCDIPSCSFSRIPYFVVMHGPGDRHRQPGDRNRVILTAALTLFCLAGWVGHYGRCGAPCPWRSRLSSPGRSRGLS